MYVCVFHLQIQYSLNGGLAFDPNSLKQGSNNYMLQDFPLWTGDGNTWKLFKITKCCYLESQLDINNNNKKTHQNLITLTMQGSQESREETVNCHNTSRWSAQGILGYTPNQHSQTASSIQVHSSMKESIFTTSMESGRLQFDPSAHRAYQNWPYFSLSENWFLLSASGDVLWVLSNDFC